ASGQDQAARERYRRGQQIGKAAGELFVFLVFRIGLIEADDDIVTAAEVRLDARGDRRRVVAIATDQSLARHLDVLDSCPALVRDLVARHVARTTEDRTHR